MITLYKEYSIGVKKLSDAELNRDNSPSGQTHIGLSEKVLTYLPNYPEQQNGILVVNQSCSFVECAFSKIGNKRSTKIDSQTVMPVKSVVKQIRNIASNAEVGWYLVWFALENQTPVFWLLNDKSEDYLDLKDIFENSQSLSVYTASHEEYFRLLTKIRSFKKLIAVIDTKYDISHENRLIAVSKEHRTFVHLCLDYFRMTGELGKMLPYFNTQEENSHIEEMPIQEEKPIEETQAIEAPVPSPNPIVQQAPIQEQAKETISNRNSELREEWIQFTATGYCACQKCCGKINGVTASGAKAVAGITVAMPSSYSFGTKIQLKSANGNLMNGGNYYTVQDRGGAIKSNRIDIFFSSHQEALNFGRRTVYLKVVN